MQPAININITVITLFTSSKLLRVEASSFEIGSIYGLQLIIALHFLRSSRLVAALCGNLSARARAINMIVIDTLFRLHLCFRLGCVTFAARQTRFIVKKSEPKLELSTPNMPATHRANCTPSPQLVVAQSLNQSAHFGIMFSESPPH